MNACRGVVVLALLASAGAAMADAWPVGDGVVVMTGRDGTWQRALGGGLWVFGDRNCPGNVLPGTAIVRTAVARDGTVGAETEILCDPYANDFFQSGWSSPVADGLDHFYAFSVSCGHGWCDYTLNALGRGWTHDAGSAESFRGWTLRSSGDGRVVATWPVEVPLAGPCRFHAAGFDSTGLVWGPDTLTTSGLDGGIAGFDGAGDAFVAWRATGYDVRGHVRVFTPAGVPRWPGELTTPAPVLAVVPDDSGGVYCVMRTYGDTVRVLRLDKDGDVRAGWPVTGVLAFGASPATDVRCAADGLGGVLVASVGATCRVQRFTAAGIAPAWDSVGRVVPLAGVAVSLPLPELIADGEGGAWLAWTQDSASASGIDVRYVHVSGDAVALDGDAGVALCATPLRQSLTDVLADGAGGWFALWDDARDGTARMRAGHVPADPRLRRRPVPMRAAVVGRAVALEWVVRAPAYAATLQRQDADTWTALGRIAADGTGRVRASDSTVAYGHAACYRLVDATDSGNVSAAVCVTMPPAPLQRGVVVHAAGLGDRAEAEWLLLAPAFAGVVDRSADDGATWTPVDTLAADGAGRIAYIDRAVRHERRYCYRLRDALDPEDVSVAACATVGAATLTIASARATSAAIDLAWDAGALPLTGTVLRAAEAGPWLEVATVAADRTGIVRFRDTGIVPYQRYCYRLLDADHPHTASASTCLVTGDRIIADAVAFSVGPSPGPGAFRVAWQAQSTAPARIAVYDLQGRTLVAGTWAPAAVGPQSDALLLGGLRAGIYIVELRHDGRVDRARAVVVR